MKCSPEGACGVSGDNGVYSGSVIAVISGAGTARTCLLLKRDGRERLLHLLQVGPFPLTPFHCPSFPPFPFAFDSGGWAILARQKIRPMRNPSQSRRNVSKARTFSTEDGVVHRATQACPGHEKHRRCWNGRCRAPSETIPGLRFACSGYAGYRTPQSIGKENSPAFSRRLVSSHAVGRTASATDGNARAGSRGRFNADGHRAPCRMR